MPTSGQRLNAEILQRLHDLRSPEDARALFRALGFTPADEHISRAICPPDVRTLIADDPRIIAVTGSAGVCSIIFLRLTSLEIDRQAERDIIARLFPAYPLALFLTANATGDRWHITHAAARAQGLSLTRLVVNSARRLHIAAERLALLRVTDPLATARAIDERLCSAFSADAVAAQFFREFIASPAEDFASLAARFDLIPREDTPLDRELAVDPGIFGSIFEGHTLRTENVPKLSTRKQLGAFFTPRPLVHYMCRTALRTHLARRLPDAAALIAQLMSVTPTSSTHDDLHALLEAVYTISVCDHAVGAGAFLVGMLQEMTALAARLESLLRPDICEQSNYLYEIKRRLLGNLYGVDIHARAVELTRLRLWLSLLADYQPDSACPALLPPLVSRVVQGDSLLEDASPTCPHFAWRKNFANVFARHGGFDIVIGNPPYLSSRCFQHKRELAERFTTAFGSYDLYIPFMEQGLRLMNPRGVVMLLTSNKFLRADYGAALRQYLCKSARLLALIDLADCPGIFDALISPAITLAAVGETHADDIVQVAVLQGQQYSDIASVPLAECHMGDLQKTERAPFEIHIRSAAAGIIARLERDAVPLRELGMLRTGVMGFDYWALAPELRDAADDDDERLRLLPNSHLAPFRFLFGKPVRLYRKTVMHPRIDERLPQFTEATRAFFRTRKVVMRGIARQTTAAWDAEGHAPLVAVHGFVPATIDGYFITGLLNSTLFNWLHRIRFYQSRIPQGSLRYPVSFWADLPIRSDAPQLMEEIAGLARCLSSGMENNEQLLARLNEKVFELYGIDQREIAALTVG